MELVAGTGEAAEPHAFEAMVGLQMREPHLNPLSLIPRSDECLCLHLPPRHFAGVFVEVARNLARLGGSAALRSDRTDVAIMLRGAVQQRVSVVHRGQWSVGVCH